MRSLMTQEVMLVDPHGKLVTTIELPNVPHTPRAILYGQRIYVCKIDMKIYQAVPFYVAGQHSQALFDEWGGLAYPEKLGPDANPFGRSFYKQEDTTDE